MRSRDGIIAALTVAGAAFGLGVYTSAHGGDTSRIHGCVDNRTGALRIIIPPQKLVGSMSAVGDSVYTNNSTTEQQRELRSVRSLTLSGPTGCRPLDMPITEWTGELEGFSLAEVGLVGPFTVE
jgi:hypothetical protein